MLVQLQENALASTLDGRYPPDPAGRKRAEVKVPLLDLPGSVDSGEAKTGLDLAQPLSLNNVTEEVLKSGWGLSGDGNEIAVFFRWSSDG